MKNTLLRTFARTRKSYKRHRPAINYIVVATLLLIPFQNCGKLAPGETTTLTQTSSDGANPIVGNTPGTGSGPTTTTMNQDQIDRQACAANEASPTFASLGPANAQMTSGLERFSGDIASNSITATGNYAVINSGIDAQHNCARFRVTTVQCVISAEPGYVAVVNRAIERSGADVANSAVTPNQKRDLMTRAVNVGNCNNRPFSNSVSFATTLERQTPNQVRCVSGSFSLQVRIRSVVNGRQVESPPRYVRVTVNDGCWNESRLKNQVSGAPADFERLAGAGTDVSIDGDWAAVTAPNQSRGSVINAGAAHIYNYASGRWNYHSLIQLSDARTDESVSSVVIKGDTLVLGSAYRNGDGAVAVFKLVSNIWSLAHEIVPPRPQANQLFGYSLAFDGSRLVVGAPHYSRSATDRAGAVYHYTLNPAGIATPVETLEWSGSDFANRGFGMKVAMDGMSLVIGAPQAITRESMGTGAIVVYSLSAGSFGTGIPRNPPTGGNPALSTGNGLRYGASLALLGTRLVVGAPGHEAVGGNTNAGGAVYYSNVNSATATRNYVSNEKDGVWGTSVGLSANGVFIGGPYRNSRGGFIEYYLNSSLGTIAYRLVNWNQTSNDAFGWAIGVSGNRVLVGARIKNDPQQSSGAVYAYEMK